MPEQTKPPSEMNSLLAPEDIEAQQRRLLEAQRLKSERKKLRLAGRQDEIKHRLSGILLDAAKKTDLRKHAFKSDEELAKLGLKPHEIRLVRQWEEPKRNAAFALESSSRQIEAHLRGQAEKQTVKINVENATIQLPEKKAETIAPVIIDVEVDGK